MATIKKTPLEAWIAGRIGVSGSLTREQISSYQLHQVRETIRRASILSPIYRTTLKGCAEREVSALADLSRFPFTTAEDLRRHGLRFLCGSQSDISRVVTLDSSGTTGAAKRLYFTPADQQLTVDFFRYGMATLVGPGDRVLILLPGERSGSVGDLLAAALSRMGVRAIPHGPVADIPETLAVMAGEKIDALVGIPSQVLALARWGDAVAKQPFRLKSVLLSTDHVPAIIAAALRKLWGCEVFEHFGMTELGLGGGTDCAAHAGYHLHEADFYFEIVDPQSGESVPEGQEGEVVVTTLTRQGMPLIRYRTGDISRLMSEPCGCGAILRRLQRITTRNGGAISLDGRGRFTLADLDEALFADGAVINFTAAVDSARKATRLIIAAVTVGQPGDDAGRRLDKALDSVTAIRSARQEGKLSVTVTTDCCGGTITSGGAKRAIMEMNDADGRPGNIFDQAWGNSP